MRETWKEFAVRYGVVKTPTSPVVVRKRKPATIRINTKEEDDPDKVMWHNRALIRACDVPTEPMGCRYGSQCRLVACIPCAEACDWRNKIIDIVHSLTGWALVSFGRGRDASPGCSFAFPPDIWTARGAVIITWSGGVNPEFRNGVDAFR